MFWTNKNILQKKHPHLCQHTVQYKIGPTKKSTFLVDTTLLDSLFILEPISVPVHFYAYLHLFLGLLAPLYSYLYLYVMSLHLHSSVKIKLLCWDWGIGGGPNIRIIKTRGWCPRCSSLRQLMVIEPLVVMMAFEVVGLVVFPLANFLQ